MNELATKFQEILQGNELISGGLLLMAAGWLGFQLRQLPLKLFRAGRHLSFRQVKIRENSNLYDTALQVVTESAIGGKGPRDLELRYIREYRDHYNSGEISGSHQLVASVTSYWARIQGRYCRVSISKGDDSEDGPNQGGSLPAGAASLRPWTVSIRVLGGGRPAVQRIADHIVQRHEDSKQKGVRIVIRTRFGGVETTYKPPRRIETLCMDPAVSERVIGAVRRFRSSRSEYLRRAQPWRLGILLKGEPGNGKTSLVHVLGSEFGCDIYIMDINSFENDSDLLRAFHATSDGSIVLFEDIDCVFEQRERQGGTDGVSFSGLLNAIDGIGSPSNGRVVVMTTNHPEKLDEALVRPGRADLQVEVGPPKRDDACDYAERMYGDRCEEHIDFLYGLDTPPTGAQLEMVLRELAAEKNGDQHG